MGGGILYPFGIISWVVNFYLSFECEFVLLFPSPFLSGIKLVSELRLHIVLVSMDDCGRRAQANQTPAVSERNQRDIKLKNLRRDVQQPQLCLEHFVASHDGSDVEDPSHKLIDWNSPPTYDEEFVQSYFSNPSQGFVDWSSLPTFDEDLVESYLSYDQKEEPVADWFTPTFNGIHPQEEKPFEEVNLSDSFTTLDGIFVSHVHDENTCGEVFDSNVEEVFAYVDFLWVNNILPSSNLMKILMFTRETMIGPFFNTFMACEEKIIHEMQLSFKVSHSNGQSFQYNHHGLVIIRRTLLIVEYHLVLILRREQWIQLIIRRIEARKRWT